MGYSGIYEMFDCVEGNIADKDLLDTLHINAVVNAANPTLMGSTQGVDGAIHKAVNDLANGKYKFCDKIRKKIGPSDRMDAIRCRRGKAVITSGYKLCDYVIHVVGAKYDGTSKSAEDCSGSSVETLESCYIEIVKVLKQHTDIENIAVPVISAGEYGFPFELAARIAVAGLSNSLIRWKEQDPEMFELAKLKKIYFFIYDASETRKKRYLQCMIDVLDDYKPFLEKNRQIVFQKSTQAHFRYMKEIQLYDEKRGYFSVAKSIRWLLMAVRIVFFPVMWLKDTIGKADWKNRRRFVEVWAVLKMFFPIPAWMALEHLSGMPFERWGGILFCALVIYGMSDTITYLLTLIVMADIQRPSANIMRSMIMLFVNYIEVAMDMALLYWIYYRNVFTLHFKDAILFGVLGERQTDRLVTVTDYLWRYVDPGIRFFFISLVFGYLATHMKQRKFRS